MGWNIRLCFVMSVLMFSRLAAGDATCFQSADPTSRFPFSELISIFIPGADDPSCRPLEPNQFRRQAAGVMRPTVTLRRDGRNNYEVLLDVNFPGRRGLEMHARARQCLDEAAPFMRGPGGENLAIRLLSTPELRALPEDQRPRRYDIRVTDAHERANMLGYPADIDCGTIIHEVLHLLGLVDEYTEYDRSFGMGYDCRVVTGVPSIMNASVDDHYEATVSPTLECPCATPACVNVMLSGNQDLIRTFVTPLPRITDHIEFLSGSCTSQMLDVDRPEGGAGLRAHVMSHSSNSLVFEFRHVASDDFVNYGYRLMRFPCQCSEGEAACGNSMRSLVRSLSTPGAAVSCPDVVWRTVSRANPTVQPVTTTVSVEPGQYAYRAEAGILNIRGTPSGAGLLHPNHFRRILAGSCAESVPNYTRCAASAYQRTRSNRGCDVPPECRDDAFFLGTGP